MVGYAEDLADVAERQAGAVQLARGVSRGLLCGLVRGLATEACWRFRQPLRAR